MFIGRICWRLKGVEIIFKKADQGLSFYFIAMAAHGQGISGGDRIFIELARRWSEKYPVTIFTWEEGKEMLSRQKLEGAKLTVKNWKLGACSRCGFLLCYLARIIRSLVGALGLTGIKDQPTTIIYSASEFWMDSLAALVLKLRYPRITWVATWYQTAPFPWQGFKEGERQSSYRLSALFYWLAQLPIKPLVRRCADLVLINNEEEKKHFPSLDKKGRAIVLFGAVNLEEIKKHQPLTVSDQPLPKVYDAVFQGRFHPQKGVVELIDIWKKVVDKIPDAELAMIGDGPLMESVKSEIKGQELEKNVKLFGYVFDGPKKYDIFRRSKIVVHPAFYDSGGMASAEAMAFSLPCVGFSLKSYESYYPQGMVKVKTGDLEAFADEIVELLENRDYREKIGKEALEMIEKNWSWDKRAREVLERIIEVVNKG